MRSCGSWCCVDVDVQVGEVVSCSTEVCSCLVEAGTECSRVMGQDVRKTALSLSPYIYILYIGRYIYPHTHIQRHI